MDKNEFLQSQLEMRRKIAEGEATWKDLNDFRVQSGGLQSVHPDTLRKGCFLLDEYSEAGWVQEQSVSCSIPKHEATTINNKGEISSEKKIPLTKDEIKDADYLLRAHGFDPIEFELVSARSSFWGRVGQQDFYASKISIRPRRDTLSLNFLEQYFKDKVFEHKHEPVKPDFYDPQGEFLEIDLPDLHLGLKSAMNECNEEYDIETAIARLNFCMYDIMARIADRGKKLSKIYFIPLGDLLHFDNAALSTTKGTPQIAECGVAETFDKALSAMVSLIDSLCALAPVEVKYVAGNHDKVLGYAIISALGMIYRKNDYIKVDSSPLPRKVIHRKNVLIGLAHGDINKNRMVEWLQSDFRKEFGESKYVEVHSGHYHSQQTIEKNGIIVRHLPALCSASSWTFEQGYGQSIKSIVSFLWNENSGLREMWFSAAP